MASPGNRHCANCIGTRSFLAEGQPPCVSNLKLACRRPRTRFVKRFVYSTRTEPWLTRTSRPSYATRSLVARQRRDLIGCSETRTVGAQTVRALWTLPLEYTRSELEFSSVHVLWTIVDRHCTSDRWSERFYSVDQKISPYSFSHCIVPKVGKAGFCQILSVVVVYSILRRYPIIKAHIWQSDMLGLSK